MVFLIACVDINNGIAKGNKVPWILKPDLARFCEMTANAVIIMGRNTWEHIGGRPLIGRTNIVVSSNPSTIDNDLVCRSLKDAIDLAIMLLKPIYIIGGEQLFEEGLNVASHVYLTRINHDFECDKFFPMKKMKFKSRRFEDWKSHNGIIYRYEYYDL